MEIMSSELTDSQLEELKETLFKNYYSSHTDFDQCFYISAKNGLKAKQNHDEVLLEECGCEALAQFIENKINSDKNQMLEKNATCCIEKLRAINRAFLKYMASILTRIAHDDSLEIIIKEAEQKGIRIQVNRLSVSSLIKAVSILNEVNAQMETLFD